MGLLRISLKIEAVPLSILSMIGMPGRVQVLATHLYTMISTGFATD